MGGTVLCLLAAALGGTHQVDLALTPAATSVLPGETVDVALTASTDAGSESIVSVEALLSWDPARLELVTAIPGDFVPFVAGFLPDPDGINDDTTDGDALYTVLTPPGTPEVIPPTALVAVFRFEVLASGCLSMPASLGAFGATRVLGPVSGQEITGDLPADLGLGALPGPYVDLGGALMGTGGVVPNLTADGLMLPCDGVTVTVADALPGAMSFIVVGFTPLGLPLKGGTLVPKPDVVIPFPTGPTGGYSLGTPSVSGIPTGFTFWTQTWIADAGGPRGFAATNGISATVP